MLYMKNIILDPAWAIPYHAIHRKRDKKSNFRQVTIFVPSPEQNKDIIMN